MIHKVHGGYQATTESGRPLSKRAKSRQEAMAQLYAVEMSMHRRGKKSMAQVRSEMRSAAHGS